MIERRIPRRQTGRPYWRQASELEQPMNEFDLQGWEREVMAWRRRLDATDAPQNSTAVRAELNDIVADIDELREHPETESEARARVERRLVRLLALYDLACRARIGSA
jgi:hypothetical protein